MSPFREACYAAGLTEADIQEAIKKARELARRQDHKE